MNITEAKELLKAADLTFGPDDEIEHYDRCLNMNDVWAWGTSWIEEIPEDEVILVASLVQRYGACGAYYWLSVKHENLRSEFHDINRMVDFVRHEEAIRAEIPDSSQRAYAKRDYHLGS